ncbi:MAG: hypothetical protein IPJ14_13905 [Kineosporiaceae bacterium]|nr:hypothetical protein [Kineosporiaceae bacterium]
MNRPPTYTVDPIVWIARTVPLTPGWKSVNNSPVAALNTANRLRTLPFTAVKSPPT